MSGGGDKGGTTTQTMKLDPRLEEGAASAVGGALASAGLDYVPNRGVTIAGFTPMQEAAFEGANNAAKAFGLSTSENYPNSVPATEVSAGGINGYSTSALYDEALLRSYTPEQLAERQAILDHYKNSSARINGVAAPSVGGATTATNPLLSQEYVGDGNEQSGHSRSNGGL